MTLKFQVAIDCTDPTRLVAFWSAALGYVPEPPPAGHASWKAYFISLGVPPDELAEMADDETSSVIDPDGVGPRLYFQPVPEGKQVKNRVHLDLDVTEGRGVDLEIRRRQLESEAARLVALGAAINRVVHTEGSAAYGITMFDPEGNEFCIR